MLVIRDTQIHALAEPELRELEEQALAHVRTEHPDELRRRGEAGVRALVGRAIAKGLGYRLCRSADFIALLSLMIVLGEGFDHDRERPWLREILGSRTLDPTDKIATILDELLVDADHDAAR